MTNASDFTPAGAAPAWRREFIALMTIGMPMGLTQLIQFSISTIDVLMIGRLGAEHLAGASLGLFMFYMLFTVGLGPAMAVSPMVSQALGADRENYREARRSVRMGLWLVGAGSILLSLIYFFTEEIAVALNQPAIAAKLAEPYVLALAPGLPFALIFIILTTVINTLLNYILIYGSWGAPRLELVGAGIASSLSHAIGFFALVVYINREATAKRFELFVKFFTPDWPLLREVARIGWPSSVTIGFEAMLFNATILLMGAIGVIAMAAHQAALNVTALAFMLPLGLSMAGGVRVGLMEGAKDAAGVRRASAVSILSCIGLIMIFAVPMALMPETIARFYFEADEAAAREFTAAFLPIAAAFALFDATQVAAAQALRGLKDVRIPMVLTGVSYWVIGFPVAAWLGLATPLGAAGVWWGLLASLVSAAVLLSARLWLITRDKPLPALSPSGS